MKVLDSISVLKKNYFFSLFCRLEIPEASFLSGAGFPIVFYIFSVFSLCEIGSKFPLSVST